MKPNHAEHLQNIADLDADFGGDGSDDDLCKRSDCWELGAGVVPCWVFEDGSDHAGRCGICDHLPECHAEDGAAAQERYLQEAEAESPGFGAALREAFERDQRRAP